MAAIFVEPISFPIDPGKRLTCYPTLLLLDKMSPPPLLSYLSPLAGLAVTAAASLVWKRRRIFCQGTGS